MNEQSTHSINTLQDVARLLPQLYSESSAKVYSAAFHRIEKLTGQRLVHLPANEKAWASLASSIVWAGHFKGRTPQAAERAFETWRGKIGAAIKRARAGASGPTNSTSEAVQAAQAWDMIHGYIKDVENTFAADGTQVLPNMSA
ncbi:MAG: hypothetical protein OTI35_16330, partial [Sulfitobacter sp.]|nr:hypothetical protein [Sulfitobacter sp.]